MDTKTNKTIAACMGLSLVAAGGLMAAVPAVATPAQAAEATVQAAAETQAIDGIVAEPQVEGTFSYSQSAVTSNATIRDMFSKAAATLCNSMPKYALNETAKAITISGADSSLTATVQELIRDSQAQSLIMACSCASNLAGGGAIANADVEGVSLASIAKIAGAI